jgi:hypothetical protein
MQSPRKPPRKIITFNDPQSAIEGLLQARVARLFQSNVRLAGVLVKLRDFYLAEVPSESAGELLTEVDAALASAEKTEDLD